MFQDLREAGLRLRDAGRTRALKIYADDNGGKFPAHASGYAAALQLLMKPPDHLMGTYLVMGAPGGYSGKVFEDANSKGAWVREADCGRVYVQGLREDSKPEIALVFDKQPSPGDHAHGWLRWNAPLRREVCLVDGSMVVIDESAWPEFARKQIELLVEAGLSPLEAIKVCTLNGATYLGIADRAGTIAAGKQADLVLIGGDPSATIGDIRKVETVFKQGVGYDPQKLVNSVKGKVGIF